MRVVTMKIAVDDKLADRVEEGLAEAAASLPGITLTLSDDKPTADEEALAARLSE